MGVRASAIDESVLRDIARTLPTSASSRVIAELDRRRAHGEDLVVVSTEGQQLVIVAREHFVDGMIRFGPGTEPGE